MNLDRLARKINTIQLFSKLGSAIDDCAIARITSWEDWTGPEDLLVEQIALRQQALHDLVVPIEATDQWNQALRLVATACSTLVPYHEGADAWYAPNIAAWSLAWTFSLEEAHLASDVAVPAELDAQLFWYERGHWPCALVSKLSGETPAGYIVF